MPPPLDKPRLRRALRRLWEIPAAGDAAERAQESLDFLALVAGMKPVYLAGRGFDDPAWIAGVRALTTELGLHAVEGLLWRPEDAVRGLPDWYIAYLDGLFASRRAIYVCKTRAILAAVEAACATGTPTIAEEARLLGFPACCVAAHHGRARAFHEMTVMIAARRAGRDAAAMQSLIKTDAVLTPETVQERDLADRSQAVRPAAFASFDLCDWCAGSSTSPGARISARYRDLAAAIDPDYFAFLAAG